MSRRMFVSEENAKKMGIPWPRSWRYLIVVPSLSRVGDAPVPGLTAVASGSGPCRGGRREPVMRGSMIILVRAAI